MGKYMRKSKVSGEVAVMEVGGALLGVRTRSRTLALQRTDDSPSAGYLELRSRRLEKQPHCPPPSHKEKESPPAARRATAVAAAASRKGEEFAAAAAAVEFDADLEVSFGDNVLDWDAVGRSTRETTPCSLIRNSETISTPGSATRTSNPMMSSRRRTAETTTCRYIPSSLEMEEFFAAAEHHQQQNFREKYNFCPANDCPLPGRYEWARLDC